MGAWREIRCSRREEGPKWGVTREEKEEISMNKKIGNRKKRIIQLSGVEERKSAEFHTPVENAI